MRPRMGYSGTHGSVRRAINQDEIAHQDTREQQKELAYAAVRRLQELTAPLNDGLKNLYERTRIDLQSDKLTKNPLKTQHLYGQQLELRWQRSFSGLVPSLDASGVNGRHGPPTKSGDAPLREALFSSADAARRIDPTLAARYHRLMVHERKHHNSALCHIEGTVLLTGSSPAGAEAPPP